jgi:hypothetical protein
MSPGTVHRALGGFHSQIDIRRCTAINRSKYFCVARIDDVNSLTTRGREPFTIYQQSWHVLSPMFIYSFIYSFMN